MDRDSESLLNALVAPEGAAFSPISKIDLSEWHGRAPCRLVVLGDTCYAVAVLQGAEPPVPQWKQEFPDFPPEDMPAEALRWTDSSWHNDACPFFIVTDSLGVFVDYSDPAKSECATFEDADTYKRFTVMPLVDGQHPVEEWQAIVHTSDWNQVLAVLIGERFAEGLRVTISAEEFAEVQRRNVDADGLTCHSHDFCDANMVMAEAFEAVMGREAHCGNEADAALWNAAWDYAKARHLTAKQGN